MSSSAIRQSSSAPYPIGAEEALRSSVRLRAPRRFRIVAVRPRASTHDPELELAEAGVETECEVYKLQKRVAFLFWMDCDVRTDSFGHEHPILYCERKQAERALAKMGGKPQRAA